MPGDVSRPVPCYARLVVLEAAQSPVGPFKLAALLVGGRYRLMPKNVLVDGIVDGAVEAVAAAFGGPFRVGSVALDRDGPRLSATVSAGGDVLATVVMPSLYAVEPSMLRWDAWLGYSSDDGVLNIVEWGPQPQAREAFLSKGATLETPAALPRSHLWRRFRSLNTISACYEEGDVALAAPTVQQAIL